MITIYFYCTKAKPKPDGVHLFHWPMRGMIVATATANKAIRLSADSIAKNKDVDKVVADCCVSWKQLYAYSKGKDVYAICLDNVSDCFYNLWEFTSDKGSLHKIRRAPQSYCHAYLGGQECYIFSDHQEYVEDIVAGIKTIELRKSLPKGVRAYD